MMNLSIQRPDYTRHTAKSQFHRSWDFKRMDMYDSIHFSEGSLVFLHFQIQQAGPIMSISPPITPPKYWKFRAHMTLHYTNLYGEQIMRWITKILEIQTPNAFSGLFAEGNPTDNPRRMTLNKCRRCKKNSSQVKISYWGKTCKIPGWFTNRARLDAASIKSHTKLDALTTIRSYD